MSTEFKMSDCAVHLFYSTVLLHSILSFVMKDIVHEKRHGSMDLWIDAFRDPRERDIKLVPSICNFSMLKEGFSTFLQFIQNAAI